MSRDLVLGVDFGSSSTVAGVLIDDRIHLIQDNGDPVIPSVVYVPERGAPEVGRRAVARQLTEPSKVVRSVKRVLGLPVDDPLVRHYVGAAPFKVDKVGDRLSFRFHNTDTAPEQIAGWVIGRARDLAEQRFGGKISRLVMTMSADAPAGYRDAVIRAARVARLEIVQLIAEPVAGALALDLHCQPADRRIIVCDFGGGTFDVSAVDQRGLAFTPIATHGDHYLGGDDLDNALAEAIAGTIFRSSRYDIHKDVVRWNELMLRCENIKRQLSVRSEVPFAMREAYMHNGRAHDISLVVERRWAQVIWEPLIERVRGIVAELLRRSGWKADDVDVVGLIGGSSSIPMFRSALTATFGSHKLLFADNAELAVAQGATLITARHRRQQSSNSIPVLMEF